MFPKADSSRSAQQFLKVGVVALAAAVLVLAGIGWLVGGPSEAADSWTDWPLGAEFVGVAVVLDGEPLAPAAVETFSFVRLTPSQASFAAFGCRYGSGAMVIEDGRLIGVDLVAAAGECFPVDGDAYFFVRRELFFGGEPAISFEQGQLLLESDRMRLVLETIEDEVVPAIPYEQDFRGSSSDVAGLDVGAIVLSSPALTVLTFELESCEVFGGYTEAATGLSVGGFSETRIPIDCPEATGNDRRMISYLASNPALTLEGDQITLTSELGSITFTER